MTLISVQNLNMLSFDFWKLLTFCFILCKYTFVCLYNVHIKQKSSLFEQFETLAKNIIILYDKYLKRNKWLYFMLLFALVHLQKWFVLEFEKNLVLLNINWKFSQELLNMIFYTFIISFQMVWFLILKLINSECKLNIKLSFRHLIGRDF